jgi:uncharacterized protein involved in exopolysaccharide biosynthesis
MHAVARNAAVLERDSDPRLDLRDLYDIVIARRRLLLPAMAICFALAFAYILLTPSAYTASMSILVDPRERVPVGLDLQPMPSNPDPALIESRMRELTSRAVLRRVIETEHLLDDPNAKPGLVGSLLEMLGDLLRGKPTVEQRLDRAVEVLARQITPKRGERSYVVDVDVKGKSPDQAVRLANALVSAYFANQSALSDELVKKQTAWLDGRVEDLRTRVEAAERRMQDYRDRQGIAETEGHTSPEQQLADANGALVAAQGRLGEVEARYAQLKAAAGQGASAESINDAIHSATIEKLRGDYAAAAREEADLRTALGPRHPSYIAAQARLVSLRGQISAEFNRIVLATERERQADRAAEASAAALVTKLETSTNAVGDRKIELTQLERDAATLRATYEKTVTARENVRRDIVESPLSVLVDPPVAGSAKTSPRAVPALLLALAGGINLWIALALLAHMRERPVNPRTPIPAPAPPPGEITDEPVPELAWSFMPVPVMETSRVMPIKSRRAIARGIGQAVEVGDAALASGPFADAIRDILVQIESYFGDSEATSRLAVAAVKPGAGASTVAVALAHVAADAGYRVLLVDCHGVRSPFGDVDDRQSIAGRNGGELVYLPFPDENRGDESWDDAEGFDLMLLDCGSLNSASYLVNRARAADAVLAVAAISSDRKAVVADIQAAGLDSCCVGAALTPVAGEARKRAS